MRVLHIYRTYFPDPPGGLQEAIRQICLATQATGEVEPRVFTLSPSPRPAIIARPEGTVVRARSWGAPASCDIGGPQAFLRFHEEAKRADMLHYHFPWPFADLLHLAAGAGTPAVMTYHSDIVRQQTANRLYAPLRQRMLARMRAVVATSPAYARTSPVLAALPPDKLHTIPLGMADAGAAADPAPVLARLGLKENGYILALGVLRYYKGLHTLVEAAPAIGAPVVIAGSGPQGEYLRAQAARIGAGNIVFTGQVDDAQKDTLLRGCRALALPSHLRSEAFGMVLLEAAMRSKPMVCCEIGSGTSYVNEDSVTGFIVPPESPQALAGALNRLLADDAMAAQMGTAARKRYERLFCGEALGRSYAALYRKAR